MQFYLTLLDNYIPDLEERTQAFAAIENIPSIRKKASSASSGWAAISELDELRTAEDRRKFLLNLICFATCIEGLVLLRSVRIRLLPASKGLLNGLAAGTNWVFRDESCHMNFALEVVNTVRTEEPELFDERMARDIAEMIDDAVECEMQFAAMSSEKASRDEHRRHPRVPRVRRRSAFGPTRSRNAATARRTRSRSWNSKTSRSSRTSSSAPSPPIRWASRATCPSTRTSSKHCLRVAAAPRSVAECRPDESDVFAAPPRVANRGVELIQTPQVTSLSIFLRWRDARSIRADSPVTAEETEHETSRRNPVDGTRSRIHRPAGRRICRRGDREDASVTGPDVIETTDGEDPRKPVCHFTGDDTVDEWELLLLDLTEASIHIDEAPTRPSSRETSPTVT